MDIPIERFPWGQGYHTAFLFNEKSSVFSLTPAKKWTLNDRFLQIGEWEVIPYKNELEKGMSLKQIALGMLSIPLLEKMDETKQFCITNQQESKLLIKQIRTLRIGSYIIPMDRKALSVQNRILG